MRTPAEQLINEAIICFMEEMYYYDPAKQLWHNRHPGSLTDEMLHDIIKDITERLT